MLANLPRQPTVMLAASRRELAIQPVLVHAKKYLANKPRRQLVILHFLCHLSASSSAKRNDDIIRQWAHELKLR